MIAATEVGLPGAMNPRKVVIDLAGLHDPDFALHGFSTDRLFGGEIGPQRRPDVIYLPHPHYQSMAAPAHPAPGPAQRVSTWQAEELGSVLGVAVARGSRAESALSARLDAMAASEESR